MHVIRSTIPQTPDMSIGDRRPQFVLQQLNVNFSSYSNSGKKSNKVTYRVRQKDLLYFKRQ